MQVLIRLLALVMERAWSGPLIGTRSAGRNASTTTTITLVRIADQNDSCRMM